MPVGSMAAKVRDRLVTPLSKFPLPRRPKNVGSDRNYMIHILFLLQQPVSMRFFPEIPCITGKFVRAVAHSTASSSACFFSRRSRRRCRDRAVSLLSKFPCQGVNEASDRISNKLIYMEFSLWQPPSMQFFPVDSAVGREILCPVAGPY
jgi:hypothetical protein